MSVTCLDTLADSLRNSGKSCRNRLMPSSESMFSLFLVFFWNSPTSALTAMPSCRKDAGVSNEKGKRGKKKKKSPPNLAKVLVEVVAVKRVLRGAQNELRLVLLAFLLGQQHAIVVDSNELVHHRPIRPLRQQRRHGIVGPVQDQQQRGPGPAAHGKVEQRSILRHAVLNLRRKLLRGRR